MFDSTNRTYAASPGVENTTVTQPPAATNDEFLTLTAAGIILGVCLGMLISLLVALAAVCLLNWWRKRAARCKCKRGEGDGSGKDQDAFKTAPWVNYMPMGHDKVSRLTECASTRLASGTACHLLPNTSFRCNRSTQVQDLSMFDQRVCLKISS